MNVGKEVDAGRLAVAHERVSDVESLLLALLGGGLALLVVGRPQRSGGAAE